MNIFEASIGDDVTVRAKSMAKSIDDLAGKVSYFGKEFRKSDKEVGNLTVRMKQAREIFKQGGNNITLFKQAMKAAGVSAMDTSLMVGKLTTELTKTRRAVLGMDGLFARVFNPKTIWMASHALNVLSKGYQFAKATAGSWAHSQYEQGKDLLMQIVDAGKLRQDTMLALTDSIRGSPEEKERGAKDLYDYMARAATKTPISTDYLMERAKELTEQGFNVHETKTLMNLIADQQTEFKGQSGEILTQALMRMKSTGAVSNRDFRSLIAAKIPLQDVYKYMAQDLGVKEKDPLKMAGAVKKLVSKGNVSSYVLMNAMIKQQEEKHGQLGAFAVKNSQTLSGAINNFQNAFPDLLKIGDVTKWQGLRVLTDFLVRAQKLITDDKGAGGRLLAKVEHFVNSVLGGLSNITDEDIEKYLDLIGDKLDTASGLAEKAWGYIDNILHAGSIKDALAEGMHAAGDVLVDLGKKLGEGIALGIKAAITGIDWKHLMMDAGGSGARGLIPQMGYARRFDERGEAAKAAGASYWEQIKAGFGFGPYAPQNAPAAPPSLNNAPGDVAGSSDALQSVPQFAAGAYVKRPTYALIGEKGPEMVLPMRAARQWASAVANAGLIPQASSAGRGGVSIGQITVPVQLVGGGGANTNPDVLATAIMRVGMRAALATFEHLAKEK